MTTSASNYQTTLHEAYQEHIINSNFSKEFIDEIQQILTSISSPFVCHYQIQSKQNPIKKTIGVSSQTVGYQTITLTSELPMTPLNVFIEEYKASEKPLTRYELHMILEQVWLGMNHLRNIAKSVKAHCLHP